MNLSRIAAANLIDSLDYCDSTRSHELRPSQRIRSRHNTRQTLRVFVAGFAGLASMAALLAWVGGQ